MNKSQKILYTIIIVALNEFLLAIYNNFFHTDAFLDEAISIACIEFIPAFIVGFICEYFLVSQVMKRLSAHIKSQRRVSKLELYLDEIMVGLGMVIIVSVYGMLIHDKISLVVFINDLFKNAIFGIPVFVLFVHKVAEKITERYLNAFSYHQSNEED